MARNTSPTVVGAMIYIVKWKTSEGTSETREFITPGNNNQARADAFAFKNQLKGNGVRAQISTRRK